MRTLYLVHVVCIYLRSRWLSFVRIHTYRVLCGMTNVFKFGFVPKSIRRVTAFTWYIGIHVRIWLVKIPSIRFWSILNIIPLVTVERKDALFRVNSLTSRRLRRRVVDIMRAPDWRNRRAIKDTVYQMLDGFIAGGCRKRQDTLGIVPLRSTSLNNQRDNDGYLDTIYSGITH